MESNPVLAASLVVAVPPAKGKQPRLAPEKPSERPLTFTKLTLRSHLAEGAGSNTAGDIGQRA